MSIIQKNTLEIGTILVNGDRKYRIVEVLGKGGFGITYLAIGEVKVDNVTTEAKFAIKEHYPSNYCERNSNAVSPKSDKVDEFKKSKSDFLAEAKKLHDLGVENKNIVKVNEVFEENGTAYYVMQYINGESLLSYVNNHGKLSYNSAIQLLSPIINALEFLHKSRINHLDIKPDNIMLHDSIDGVTPILIDFGLSIHFKKNGDKTTPKSVMGVSHGYSPLEQYAGIKEFIPQADIYALIATLLFMITGETPESAPDLKISELRKQISGRLPENIVSGICKALNKSYEDRTASVSQLKSDLGLIPSGGKSSDTVVIDTEEEERKKRKRMFLSIGAIGIIVLGICIAVFIGGKKSPEKASEEVIVTDSLTQVQNDRNDSTENEQATPLPTPSRPSEETPSIEDKEAEHSTHNHTAPSPIPEPEPVKPQPQKPDPSPIVKESTGTLSLGYATWTGEIKNGKPDGKGRMTFNSAHRVTGSVEAQPGEYIVGTYERGKLVNGKYYDSNGNFIKSVIP